MAMHSSPIAVIIQAAFQHEIDVNTNGLGKTDVADVDDFIDAVEAALASIKAQADARWGVRVK